MDEARAFIMQFPIKHFVKGQTLIYQDVEIDSLYAIRSGFVKIHDSSPSGDEQLIWIAKKYDFVPLEWIFSGEVVSRYYYSAFTDVETYAVDKKDFLVYTLKHPEVMPAIIRAISDMYKEAMILVNALQKPRAREKLIYTLSFIVSRFIDTNSKDKRNSITVPLTQQDLANLSGMTRATATVELKKLKDEGYIHYDKASFSISTQKLEELL